MKTTPPIMSALAVLACAASGLSAAPLESAFSYQGRLLDEDQPADGLYDLRFALYDLASGGSPIAGPVTNSAVGVSNGLVTTVLDFGDDVFIGEARWLEVAVRAQDASEISPLTSRQALTPTPYALHATSASAASTALTAASAGSVVAGGVANASLQAGAVSSAKIADGTITATDVAPNAFWKSSGNAGTTAGTHFLGTTDHQPLEFHVNGVRALSIEPGVTSPRLVGGYSGNVATGEGSAVLSGGTAGAFNQNQGAYSAIAGGVGNTIGGVQSSYIGGGAYNTVEIHAGFGAIGGGAENLIRTNAFYGVISGGFRNVVGDYSSNASVGGGTGNTIESIASASTVAGGSTNTIGSGSQYATIGGGWLNSVRAGSEGATVGGLITTGP